MDGRCILRLWPVYTDAGSFVTASVNDGKVHLIDNAGKSRAFSKRHGFEYRVNGVFVDSYYRTRHFSMIHLALIRIALTDLDLEDYIAAPLVSCDQAFFFLRKEKRGGRPVCRLNHWLMHKPS